MKTALRNLGCISLGLALGCTVVEEPSFLGDPIAADDELTAAEPLGDPPITAVNEPMAPGPDGCPPIYSQELLPRFDLKVDPAVMATLYEDWVQGREANSLDEDDTPYRPLAEFRYGEIAITDARIRLRGNPNFWLEQNKMQFQISFDEIDDNGRFLGLRKVLFDAATFNRHFLRDRLSLYLMREAGITAPCANNALLYINGEYYGLFTSLEKPDESFLSRVFPGNDTGKLTKRRDWDIEKRTDLRLQNLLLASDYEGDGANGNLPALENLLDVDQALLVYAIDAVIPNSDGPWAGGLNFYVYDHPGLGKYVIIPWDLDNTFDRLTPEVDPVNFVREERYHGRAIYNTLLADDAKFDVYVAKIQQILADVYRHDDMWALTGNDQYVPVEDLTPGDMRNLGTWSLQIREAAFADVNKPYTNERLEDRREAFAEFLRDRSIYLCGWVNDNGGSCSQQ
jgi:hypothetical protein